MNHNQPAVVVSASDPATVGDAEEQSSPEELARAMEHAGEDAVNETAVSETAATDAPEGNTSEENDAEASDQASDEAAEIADQEVDRPLVEEVDAEAVKESLQTDEDEALDDEFVPDVLDMPPKELRGVIEALMLVSNKPLKIERIEKCLPGINRDYLAGFLRGLGERYTREERGWDLRAVGGGYQLLTRVQFHPWVRQLDKKELPTKLSKSAMETLAIVAYKQPVSRGKIEDIRGVQCGPMLRQLMDMHLVHVVGRDEEALGRPLLYATTEQFLQRFGIGSVDDLPRQHEFGG